MPYIALDKSTAQAAPSTTVGDPLTVANGLSFQALADELDLRLFQRNDVDEPRRIRFLELAYYDLCTSLKLDDLKASIDIPVVSGQPLYLLPRVVATIQEVAIVEPTSVSTGRGRPLEMIDLGAYRSRSDEEGLVREWFRHTGMLVVWPKADYTGASLSMDFRIRPTMPTANFATFWPILEAEWHEALLLLAKQKALAALEEPERAMVAQNDFINYVRRRLDFQAVDMDLKPFRSSIPRSAAMMRKPRSDIGIGG